MIGFPRINFCNEAPTEQKGYVKNIFVLPVHFLSEATEVQKTTVWITVSYKIYNYKTISQ